MNKDFLIAVDLDGTLVTDFDNYDHKSIRYLKKLAKTNYVVIATGRPYRSTKPAYEMLELDTQRQDFVIIL
jgi:hydroxymethylpyrimidine pyrophosphatase-like HAD family hydrolase